MGYESAIGRYGFIGFGSKHDVRVIDEGPVVTFVRIDGANFYIPIRLMGIPNNQKGSMATGPFDRSLQPTDVSVFDSVNFCGRQVVDVGNASFHDHFDAVFGPEYFYVFQWVSVQH